MKRILSVLAVACVLLPQFACPMFKLAPLLVFKRFETWEKPGAAKVTLIGEQHHVNYPEQDTMLLKILAAQPNSRVFVEDPNEDFRDKFGERWLGSHHGIGGLVGKLKKIGVPASSIECRDGICGVYGIDKAMIAAAHYKNIVDGLKIANPTNPFDVYTNAIIDHAQKRDALWFQYLEAVHRLCAVSWKDKLLSYVWPKYYAYKYRMIKDDVNEEINKKSCAIGSEIIDIRALKGLCKPAENNEHRVLIAGESHCNNVARSLEYFGYSRIKKPLAVNNFQSIMKVYKQLLPPEVACNSTLLYEHGDDPLSFVDLLRVLSASQVKDKQECSAVSPKKIAEYFERPDLYEDMVQKGELPAES